MNVKNDRSLLAAKLAISRRYVHNAIDSQQPDRQERLDRNNVPPHLLLEEAKLTPDNKDVDAGAQR